MSEAGIPTPLQYDVARPPVRLKRAAMLMWMELAVLLGILMEFGGLTGVLQLQIGSMGPGAGSASVNNVRLATGEWGFFFWRRMPLEPLLVWILLAGGPAVLLGLTAWRLVKRGRGAYVLACVLSVVLALLAGIQLCFFGYEVVNTLTTSGFRMMSFFLLPVIAIALIGLGSAAVMWQLWRGRSEVRRG